MSIKARLSQQSSLTRSMSGAGAILPPPTLPPPGLPPPKMAWKAGYLVKRGHQIKNWKKRWFTVGGGRIKYYADKNAGLKGEVDLVNTTLSYERREDKEVNGKRAVVFKIIVGDGTANRSTLMVAFASQEEASEWGNVMQAVHMDPNGQIWLTRSAKEGDCAGIQACLECGVAAATRTRPNSSTR